MIDVSHQANLEQQPNINTNREAKMCTSAVSVFYGDKQALRDVSIQIYDDLVTAFIGPSG